MVQGGPEDDDPTIEEEILEFDGSTTDQLDETYRMRVVSASENGKGTVDHDERGRAKWKWSTEASAPATADTGTFNLLKALDNDSLSLSQEIPALDATSVDKHVGYNPYDAVTEKTPAKGFAAAKRTIKPR